MSKPLFVTLGNDGNEWPVTLLTRYPGDRDYFPVMELDQAQYGTLRDQGVFELTDEAGVRIDGEET